MALTLNRGAARLLSDLCKFAPISATRLNQWNAVHDSHASAINARRFHVGSPLRNIINIQVKFAEGSTYNMLIRFAYFRIWVAVDIGATVFKLEFKLG